MKYQDHQEMAIKNKTIEYFFNENQNKKKWTRRGLKIEEAAQEQRIEIWNHPIKITIQFTLD